MQKASKWVVTTVSKMVELKGIQLGWLMVGTMELRSAFQLVEKAVTLVVRMEQYWGWKLADLLVVMKVVLWVES